MYLLNQISILWKLLIGSVQTCGLRTLSEAQRVPIFDLVAYQILEDH